ncbi:uncharacterized protein BJ212DRAFT_1326120, partial [Suillus subaureus]
MLILVRSLYHPPPVHSLLSTHLPLHISRSITSYTQPSSLPTPSLEAIASPTTSYPSL